MPFLTIAASPKGGRGVFTTKNIPAGTVLEISPVLVLTAKERKAIETTKLFHYVFEWGKTRKQCCVAFGNISMYNHDYDANCIYEMDFDGKTMTIMTVKKVSKGEELFINYNADPEDKTKVWFDTK